MEDAFHDEGLDAPIPAGWTRDPAGFAHLMDTKLSALGTALDDVDPGAAAEARAERFLSTRPPLLRGGLVDRVRLSELDDRTHLMRRRGSVCELRVRDGRVIALLGDRRLELPGWVEPAMRHVVGAEALTVGELQLEIADAESRAVLCRRLVREGLLQIRAET